MANCYWPYNTTRMVNRRRRRRRRKRQKKREGGGRGSSSSCTLQSGPIVSYRIASHRIGSLGFGYAMLARHAMSAYSVLFSMATTISANFPLLLFHATPFFAPFLSASFALSACSQLSRTQLKDK